LSLQTVLLRGFVRRFCFAGLAGRTAPAPDRPQARTYAPNYSANLAVSRSYRTNSKASEQEQTVLVQTEHEYESSTEDRMYRI